MHVLPLCALQLFIVQELCGPSLFQVILAGCLGRNVSDRVAICQGLYLLLDIACGLEHLHTHNVIHGGE